MSDLNEDGVEKVVILGSGPAGLTAALYTARADLSPLMFEGQEPGGQLMTTTDVENFPGFEEGIMGPDLMAVMKKQVARFGTRFDYDEVIEVDFSSQPLVLKTAADKVIRTRTVIHRMSTPTPFHARNAKKLCTWLNGNATPVISSLVPMLYRIMSGILIALLNRDMVLPIYTWLGIGLVFGGSFSYLLSPKVDSQKGKST